MSARQSRPLLIALTGMALVLGACRTGSAPPTDSTSPAESAVASVEGSATASVVESVEPSSEPTDDLGPFACEYPVEGVGSTAIAHMTDLRIGGHDGYDRIVFEFAEGIPMYTVDSAEPPFTQDASGNPLTVNGSAFLKIVLNGGTRAADDGNPMFELPSLPSGLSTVVDFVNGGDFEAVSTWYVGLSNDACVRVFTLDAPNRLVVDIEG